MQFKADRNQLIAIAAMLGAIFTFASGEILIGGILFVASAIFSIGGLFWNAHAQDKIDAADATSARPGDDRIRPADAARTPPTTRE